MRHRHHVSLLRINFNNDYSDEEGIEYALYVHLI